MNIGQTSKHLQDFPQLGCPPGGAPFPRPRHFRRYDPIILSQHAAQKFLAEAIGAVQLAEDGRVEPQSRCWPCVFVEVTKVRQRSRPIIRPSAHRLRSPLAASVPLILVVVERYLTLHTNPADRLLDLLLTHCRAVFSCSLGFHFFPS